MDSSSERFFFFAKLILKIGTCHFLSCNIHLGILDFPTTIELHGVSSVSSSWIPRTSLRVHLEICICRVCALKPLQFSKIFLEALEYQVPANSWIRHGLFSPNLAFHFFNTFHVKKKIQVFSILACLTTSNTNFSKKHSKICPKAVGGTQEVPLWYSVSATLLQQPNCCKNWDCRIK